VDVYPRPTVSVIVTRRVGIVIPFPHINALTIDPPVISPPVVNIDDPLDRPIMFDDVNVARPTPVVIMVAINDVPALDVRDAITFHDAVMSDNALPLYMGDAMAATR
jgi:hypothetical protein